MNLLSDHTVSHVTNYVDIPIAKSIVNYHENKKKKLKQAYWRTKTADGSLSPVVRYSIGYVNKPRNDMNS